VATRVEKGRIPKVRRQNLIKDFGRERSGRAWGGKKTEKKTHEKETRSSLSTGNLPSNRDKKTEKERERDWEKHNGTEKKGRPGRFTC